MDRGIRLSRPFQEVPFQHFSWSISESENLPMTSARPTSPSTVKKLHPAQRRPFSLTMSLFHFPFHVHFEHCIPALEIINRQSSIRKQRRKLIELGLEFVIFLHFIGEFLDRNFVFFRSCRRLIYAVFRESTIRRCVILLRMVWNFPSKTRDFPGRGIHLIINEECKSLEVSRKVGD
jgi:hypothetical protein